MPLTRDGKIVKRWAVTPDGRRTHLSDGLWVALRDMLIQDGKITPELITVERANVPDKSQGETRK